MKEIPTKEVSYTDWVLDTWSKKALYVIGWISALWIGFAFIYGVGLGLFGVE